MKSIRTPEHCFQNLPDYPFEPNYIEVNGLRMHYLDEGKGEIVLCLHGEPSWSYLYRKFIPILSPQNRVIAPDLIGFGKSDKLVEMKDYNFKMHFDALISFVEQLDLNNITIVVQDWGGLLGLSLVGHMPERFARLVIMNTFLPTGDRPMPMAFKIWSGFAKYFPVLPIGFIMSIGSYQPMSAEVKAAYNAPFPDNSYKAGAKMFPAMVPLTADDEGVPEMKHARKVLSEWTKPAITIWSDKDPIMGRGDRWFRKLMPALKDVPEIVIKNAGHFLQEDKGEEIANEIKKFLQLRVIS